MRARIDLSGLTPSDEVAWNGFLRGLRGATGGAMNGGSVGTIQVNGHVIEVLNRLLVPQTRALTSVVGSGTAVQIEGWLASLPKAAQLMSAIVIPAHLCVVLAEVLLPAAQAVQ